MTAPNLISCDAAVVKAELLDSFARLIEPLFESARCGQLSPRDAERRTWSVMVPLGAMLLTALFAVVCRRATEQAVAAMRLGMVDVEPRMGKDYWVTLETTFGPVRFPWFAFRTGGRTCVPARALFPLRRLMRATELLLEWEVALAADHPFRKAAEALLFFTHGAANIEDNTVERHALIVGNALPREWMYRTVAEIRRILAERATCDTKTGRPIIYASTDAHALMRFVDESWTAAWKMSNGIRLWCVDKVTGATIHIGGEYTWNDCEGVADIFRALQKSGHLPADGNYGGGLLAQVALLTDGIDWIASRILPLFPGAVLILDLYHVIEQVAAAARKLYPTSKSKAKKLVQEARKVLGVRTRRARATDRKGPRHPRPPHPEPVPTGGALDLYDLLVPLLKPSDPLARREKLWHVIEYVVENAHRMHYGDYRARGFQIGSGAMESLHRTASQLRLKRPGCRCTPDTTQAILNIRMLQLCGRCDEYWGRPDLARDLGAAAHHVECIPDQVNIKVDA